jgi:hypothetical protein
MLAGAQWEQTEAEICWEQDREMRSEPKRAELVSCGQGWRTKLNFRSREPFDDRHRGTTLGTVPSVAAIGEGRVLELLFWRRPQGLEAEQQSGAACAGMPTPLIGGLRCQARVKKLFRFY